MRSLLRTLPVYVLAAASVAMAAQPSRIPGSIDGSQTVVLTGSVHDQARPEYDQGPADPSLPLPYVVMLTKPSPAQQAELEKLLAEQQDSASPNYHKWLTPENYADRFGVSPSDVEKITTWLRSQGFGIVQVARARDWIAFSATAGLVENTFHTRIHRYQVDGELHFANATEVAIPKALAGTVTGFRGLHDFRWKPMGISHVVPSGTVQPLLMRPFFSIGGNNFLAPDDFATIYDLNPVYMAGIDGTGAKLVVVGQVTVVMADIEAFRSGFNLSKNDPTVTIVPGTTPGNSAGDLLESDLDLEWAGAIARNATILFITSGDVFDSATYAIDNILAPVISMSYGGCERRNAGFIAVNEPIMQQANAEGITFLASSGDSGPASCDAPGGASVAGGLAVSYPASSPEVTGVGGNEFSGDVPDPTPYWNPANGPNGGSAIQYIPETAWNDTVERGSVAAGGGGKSSCHSSPCSTGFTKPSWQSGTGVPNDGVRDVPDVSFNASPDHDGYIMCNAGSCAAGVMNGNFLVAGGTSASTPAFAGILTLLNQQLGNLPPTGLGNINPTLYRLAQTPANNVFHDITTGNNIVPCAQGSPNCPKTAPFQYGYNATVGYDLVTGLGSMDVDNLFANWNNDKIATNSVLSSASSTIPAGSTQPLTLKAVVSPNSGNGTPTGAVTFFLNGSTLAGTGTLTKGSASVNYNPKSLKAGLNTFTAAYGGDVNFSNSESSAVTVTVQDFSVALPTNVTNVTVDAPGGTATATLTITPEFGFSHAVSFSCSPLPAEATCNAASVTPDGGPVTATLTFSTRGPSAKLLPGFRGRSLFYAFLIPGLFGIALFSTGNGKGHLRRLRLLTLIGGVMCVSMWTPACGGGGGTSTPPDPGTPAGSTSVSIVATGTGGAPTHPVKITLTIK